MLRSMATDPAALFRVMLGEWEKLTNGMGGDLLKTDEWSRAMNGAQTAALQAQGAVKEQMGKALAAANMPSRAEFEDLSARLGRMEATLARIEAAVVGGVAIADRPRPTRTRKPPAGAA